ncbi:MAG: hypothetical protein RLZ53_1149 [Actinomycetota bacterium]|jgi:hypothetical protein
MELIIKILLVLHIIGVGALLSGFFYQMKNMKTGMEINAGILHGAWLMLVTGLAMTGLLPIAEPDEKLNHLVIGIKSMVITAIFFIAYGYNKREKTAKWAVPVIALLTIVNISLAVIGL